MCSLYSQISPASKNRALIHYENTKSFRLVSHLPCFALCRKTTPNKQRIAKPCKMAINWAQVTQKKQQQTKVCVSTIFFQYSCLYFYVLTTILNFSYRVFKSFVICKTVSKLAVLSKTRRKISSMSSMAKLKDSRSCFITRCCARWNYANFNNHHPSF